MFVRPWDDPQHHINQAGWQTPVLSVGRWRRRIKDLRPFLYTWSSLRLTYEIWDLSSKQTAFYTVGVNILEQLTNTTGLMMP